MKKEKFREIFISSLSGFFALAMAIVLYFAIKRFSGISDGFHRLIQILMPFIYGGVMAFLLKTPVNFMERKLRKLLPEKRAKLANALAITIVVILALLIVFLLLCSVIPETVDSIVSLVQMVPDSIGTLVDWLEKMAVKYPVVETYLNAGIDAIQNLENQFLTWLQGDAMSSLQEIAQGVFNQVKGIVTFVFNWIIGIIVCIYILAARRKFARQGKAVVYAVFKPSWADAVMDEIRFIDRTFVGFFAGKILDSAIIGVICYVFCLIMSLTVGFENSVLISIIIGVTNIIPYFGPFIGAIPTALIVLMDSPIHCLVFLIFILILQQFDGNILGPKCLSGTVGISSFWVLFSIMLFSGWFGFVGFIVGVPLFAVIYDIVKRLVVRGLKRHDRLAVLYGEDAEKKDTADSPEEEHADEG